MTLRSNTLANTSNALTWVSAALFCIHAYFLFGLMFMFGASLLNWAEILLAAGPIVCVLSFLVALIPPRRGWRVMFNCTLLLIYLLYWGSMYPKIHWNG